MVADVRKTELCNCAIVLPSSPRDARRVSFAKKVLSGITHLDEPSAPLAFDPPRRPLVARFTKKSGTEQASGINERSDVTLAATPRLIQKIADKPKNWITMNAHISRFSQSRSDPWHVQGRPVAALKVTD